MKKHFRRPAAWILLAALMAAGCGSQSTGDDTRAEDTSSDTVTEAPGGDEIDYENMSFIEKLTYNREQIDDGLPQKDYGGEAFRIGFLWFDESHMYSMDWLAEGETGEVINDAVYARNRAVEERFNVELEFVKHASKTYESDMRTPILANEDAYDMMSMHPSFYRNSLLGGLLANFDELPYVDLSKPWWMSDSVKSLSLDDEIYLAYGAATGITLLADSPVMYFNKKLAGDYGMDNLYDLVREGGWTLDTFLTLTKDGWRDLDGNGSVNDADQFGYVVPEKHFYRLFWSLGGRYIEKDSDGGLTLFTNAEKVYGIFDKVGDLLINDNTFINPGWDITVFVKGRSLFANGNMSCALNVLRDTDFAYGILPNFKLDEQQDHYLTNGGGGPLAVPITCSDFERTSILMEALCAESYKRVIPSYYDQALKGKYAGDDNDMEMLDIIYSNVVYDSSRAYCAAIETLIESCLDPTFEPASAMASLQAYYQKQLDDSTALYRKLYESEE